jgi:hypothetical protein
LGGATGMRFGGAMMQHQAGQLHRPGLTLHSNGDPGQFQ